MKLSKLNIAIASGLSLTLLSGAAIAAFPVPIGDSRIHFPVQQTAETILVTTDSTDVWFVAADDADGYLVDLRSTKNAAGNVIGGTGEGNCSDVTGATTATTPTNIVQKFIPADSPDLSCGLESVTTLTNKNINGDPDTAVTSILCKWKTPVLADGKYLLGINSLKFGAAGGNEIIGTCLDTTLPIGADLNKHEAAVLATPASVSYQQFEIKNAGGAVTQKPDGVTLTAPGFEGNQDGVLSAAFAAADSILVFEDASPAAGKATWYEVFIYDKNNVRVSDIKQDNLAFNNWYKTGVDAAGIECTPDKVKADGSKYTECKIDLESLTVNTTTGGEAGLSTVGDTFTWWIRGYNDEFGAGPWSSKGTFKSAD